LHVFLMRFGFIWLTAPGDALFIPFAMSTNGALGPEASKFLTMVFKFVKPAGMFSMRHSHQDAESTWNTTWFSTFWRQRISSAVTATNAAFVNRILQRDAVADVFLISMAVWSWNNAYSRNILSSPNGCSPNGRTERSHRDVKFKH